MADVAMPRLSDSMEEGTILKWLKSDGDEVARGEELVEIETDKANMTYEADEAGTLSIVASEGDTLQVGELIARIGAGGDGDGAGQAEEKDEGEDEPDDGERDDGDEAEEDTAEPQAAERQDGGNGRGAQEEEQEENERSEAPPRAEQPHDDGAGTNGAGERVKASPIARRMAREMGVELGALQGTGPGGRIVKADVEAAAKGQAEEAPAAEERGAVETAEPEREPERAPEPKREPEPAQADGRSGRGESRPQDLTRLQQTVARRMAESK